MKNFVDHIPVFLINLDRAPHRLARMDEKLRSLGIAYERFAAIDGRALPPDSVETFAPRETWTKPTRRPIANEVACFQSHLSVLQIIRDRSYERACVLEDDLDLAPDFGTFLDPTLKFPPNTDFLKLEVTQVKRLKVLPLRPIGARTLGLISRGGDIGAAAYVVTARGVRNLLPNLKPMVDFYDNQAFGAATLKPRVYHVIPFPADQEDGSEMGRPQEFVSEKKGTTPKGKRLRKPLHRKMKSSIKKRMSFHRKVAEYIRVHGVWIAAGLLFRAKMMERAELLGDLYQPRELNASCDDLPPKLKEAIPVGNSRPGERTSQRTA
ncbi:glycosyl transferase family 25 [Rhodomicrobium vannielii ATCC 17100]|uniref:Glycosyl transferase family 25 n=2 Tax=Rhodomicrobium vannielii TaxID=1069 RepID=E3I5M9_RHOVT|nr:glycosyltransferase family 25 protein [Rhodomicrobium vannielii]ADP72840.1 glycosyl transferase family 25 [Rhodomicrobium vannielii ATCC 17100]